ncbi:NrfD/PsrC family molybdoenzyme membrane anchor subunit [Sedimenticola thiotaurini]|uniref:Tetrathionate reductase n=1 Tax=Sedimenticola thiotaurini TaxID=1543721 RepID=A0A0F7JX03_9GAMM|nr:NrfD/PsrC family molybdoenzyme membrane anchor subunit [Sedimenticola thiotaurini]AKH19123.1 hypothetical protein AAY24_00795 [Sedimenticola thiotaurini]
MNSNLIEIISVSQASTWNSWAVQYFFFIGLSIGGVLLTIPALVLRKSHWLPIARLSLIVAVTTGLVAPVALLADLHQPARFYNFYLHFTPTSWMSWGAFLLPTYLLSLMLFGFQALYRDRDNRHSLTRLAAIATSVLGAGIALYTGSEMGILISRVLWQVGWLVPGYLISGLAGAAGLALVLNNLQSDTSQDANQRLVNWLNLFLILTGAWIVAWGGAGHLNLSNSGMELLRLMLVYQPVESLLLWIGLGLALPLLLGLINQSAMNVVTGLLAVFGAWMLRWVMFIGGQGIPKNGAGFYLFDLPLGTEGLLGILGSLGLWMVFLIVIRTLLSQYHPQARA